MAKLRNKKLLLLLTMSCGGLLWFALLAGARIWDISDFEVAIRHEFASRLQPLPAISYETALGFRPTLPMVELGRQLFNDPILNRNNDTSCATCHLSNHGFSIGTALAFGALGAGGATSETVGEHFAEGQLSTQRQCGDDGLGFLCQAPMFRNVPSTINVAFRANRFHDSGLLWDGRFGRLEFQTLLPILTHEELCGTNPVRQSRDENLFAAGQGFFRLPVEILNSHIEDPYLGRNLQFFNSGREVIRGVPSRRADGSASVPTRNECLAIAVAKVRTVADYREAFAQAFGDSQVTDERIGKALASLVATHVAKDTPFDQFARGRSALTDRQMMGLAAFITVRGEVHELAGRRVTGAGCVNCHELPTFGGSKFAGLGVRSPFSIPEVIFNSDSLKSTIRGQRGQVPHCHIEGRTVALGNSYAPDIGRANATALDEDCFRFRVPPLRNVIETFPYFHHGTARAQGFLSSDLKERSLKALSDVIQYHLRGPINVRMINQLNINQKFFDPTFQLDELIPVSQQDLTASGVEGVDVEALVDFVAWGLFDPSATSVGDLGNDVRHPKSVLSGFAPAVTRDFGNQQELPPAGDRL